MRANRRASIGPPVLAAQHCSTVSCQPGWASANAATAASSVAVPRAASSAAGPACHSRRWKSANVVGRGE
jgi:hypothetical protein